MDLLIAGDFCPQNRVVSLFDSNNYQVVLGEIKPIVEQSDYSIVNLECPVIEGLESPIPKQGPNLYCTEKGVEALKWAGFDCVTLANNHFFDFGEKGVLNTITKCHNHGLDIVGGGEDLKEASRVLYKKINGQTLGVVNCCEHEFSIANNNRGGSNPLNPIQQFYALKEARINADYIIVIIHGGHELWQLPSPRMVETYRFFIDAGADAVINHHQHCFSGYETYRGKPIFYGIGNFCFDKPQHRNDIWNFGYMVRLSLGKQLTFKILPYIQCGDQPKVSLLPETSIPFDSLPNLNDIINDPKELTKQTQNYYKSKFRFLKLVFEPYSGKIFRKLYLNRLLPSFLTDKKLASLRNYIECESHRDVVVNFLND